MIGVVRPIEGTHLVDSVLPAPDSPETMMDCDCLTTFMSRKALSAMANTCGGMVPRDRPCFRGLESH